MKIAKIASLLLIVALAGILVGTRAGAKTTTPPPSGTNYQLNAVITNNPSAVVADVTGLPAFSELASNNPYGVVYTDGGGKIDGIEDMVFTNLQLSCGPYTSGDFVTRITGSITSVGKSNEVIVTMLMKGGGYVQNETGSTQAQANLNLQFTGKLFATNSVINTTSTFVEIGTNNAGIAFTNVYTYFPETNYVFTNAYQTLDVIYLTETSVAFPTNTAAGTNTVLVQNEICQTECPVNFGVPTGTTNTMPFNTCLCSNLFTNLVVIGTNITYRSRGTNIVLGLTKTNYIFGLDISNVPAYIAAMTSCNTSNGVGIVQTFAVVTNTVTEFSSTNVLPYAVITQPTPCAALRTNNVGLTFSNGWFEVDGTLRGRIATARCQQSFKGTNASLYLPFTSYTTFTGSGANTNGPFFGPNCPIVSLDDLGVMYVVREDVSNNDLRVVPASGSFSSATIKQFGQVIYASASGALAGAGSINQKKQTYHLPLTGVGYLHGSSLVATGALATNLIVAYTLETNIVTLTNFAANPPDAGFVTNDTFSTGSETINVPAQTIAGQTVGGGFFDFFNLTTNGIGTTNLVVTNTFICPQVTLPPIVITNTVDGIRTISGQGRVLGQRTSVSGTNADLSYP